VSTVTRSYSPKTYKILFAQSGNKCAHPACSTPVIIQAAENSKPFVSGQICHIRPASADGPRANAQASRADLNDPSNLIILCPTHHAVVDSDPETYTEIVLKSWKDAQIAITARQVKSNHKIDIARLPSTTGNLLGRRFEVTKLDKIWEERRLRLVSIVALGGIGKSALVSHWLANMRADQCRDTRIFAWSFYAQGTTQELASSSEFFEEALAWFGDPTPQAGDERDKGRRLAALVQTEPTILILDGMEPLQQPPGPEGGKIVDPAIETLLTLLASANPGLCIVTTRYHIPNLDRFRPNVDAITLEGLQGDDGVDLLKSLGVRGSPESITSAVREYGGHPLALHLLGTFLRDVYDGDIERRADIPLREWDTEQGGKARRIMQSYKNWLGFGAALQILHLLGLFDRPAEAAALSALRMAPPINGLTDRLTDPMRWAAQLSRLRSAGLIAAETAERTGELDTHPLVRDFFGSDVFDNDRAAWLEGHLRLYEYLKRSTPQRPDSLAGLFPLFSAISHGCKAGRHQECLRDLYIGRIQRGRSAWYSTKRFGIPTHHLAALSHFIEPGTEIVRAELADEDKIYVLMERAYQLRALGRLRDSIPPLMAARAECAKGRLLRDMTSACDCLAESHLYMGEISAALEYAEETVKFANASGRNFEKMYAHCTLANGQHFAGLLDDAAHNFKAAEAIQAERQAHSPRLKSLNGIQLCDFLISIGKSPSAVERAREIMAQLGKSEDTVVSRAIAGVVLARASSISGLEPIDSAAEILRMSCDILRATGQAQEYTIALISWAAFAASASGRFRDEIDQAIMDAEEIVQRLDSDILRIEVYSAKRKIAHRDGDINAADAHLHAAQRLRARTGYRRPPICGTAAPG
jgi:tetratricopeptide (TPR) repeat protein